MIIYASNFFLHCMMICISVVIQKVEMAFVSNLREEQNGNSNHPISNGIHSAIVAQYER